MNETPDPWLSPTEIHSGAWKYPSPDGNHYPVTPETMVGAVDSIPHPMVRQVIAAELARLRDLVIQARTQHCSDIAKIGDRLLDEAEQRGWCHIFDDVVDEINSDLVVRLPERKREFAVTHTYTVRITRVVQARDYDDAEEIAGPPAYPFKLDDSLVAGGYGFASYRSGMEYETTDVTER